MRVTAQATDQAPTVEASCRQWQALSRFWLWLATAALVSAAGCAGSRQGVEGDSPDLADTSGAAQAAADEPIQSALHNGVFATPQNFGGFSANGVGVFLSAVNDVAELTLYVVAPAQSAAFGRPALYLTTQQGDHVKTDVAEFEDVTLEAGESRVFSEEAGGRLTEVFADFVSNED
jgi:hypothetical protein